MCEALPMSYFCHSYTQGREGWQLGWPLCTRLLAAVDKGLVGHLMVNKGCCSSRAHAHRQGGKRGRGMASPACLLQKKSEPSCRGAPEEIRALSFAGTWPGTVGPPSLSGDGHGRRGLGESTCQSRCQLVSVSLSSPPQPRW